MKEYVFDLKLFATIAVPAQSESEARKLIATHIDSASTNFGAWPDGSPILGEASADGEPDFIEVRPEE